MEEIKYKWCDFLVRYITANHHINENIFNELDDLTMKFLNQENNDFFHWFSKNGICDYISFLEEQDMREETKRNITLEEEQQKTILFFEIELRRAYEID